MLTTIIAAAVAVVGAPDAAADEAADYRCLAVTRRLVGSAAEKDRAAVQATSLFFLGKLSATHGWMEISLRLSATPVPGDLMPEAQRCAKEITDLMRQIRQ